MKFQSLIINVFGMVFIFGVVFMQSCTNNSMQKKGDLRFQQLQVRLEKLQDQDLRQQAVNEFINKVKAENYPVFENDSTVVLLYQSKNDTAFILGDMGDWTKFIPMLKLAGTDLFFVRLMLEPQARLEYWIMEDKAGFPMVDPLNPYKVLNGLGTLSEIAMPAYERHPYFDDYLFGKEGSTDLVQAMEIGAGILPYTHQLHVYLPPGYEAGKEEYAVVYFQDGIDYVKYAQASQTIDTLIRDNKIEPLIAVFITPPNHLKAEMPNRMTEYGLNEDYVKFVCDELVPFIDEKYRTKATAKARLVLGDSFGGLISAYIPFSRPDVFKNGYSQSGYQSFQDDKLIKTYQEAERKEIRLYVDTGTYERQVGAGFLPVEEGNFLEANRRFKNVLQEKGYDFVYKEYFEGHTWGNWRRHLIDGLLHFYGK